MAILTAFDTLKVTFLLEMSHVLHEPQSLLVSGKGLLIECQVLIALEIRIRLTVKNAVHRGEERRCV